MTDFALSVAKSFGFGIGLLLALVLASAVESYFFRSRRIARALKREGAEKGKLTYFWAVLLLLTWVIYALFCTGGQCRAFLQTWLG